MFSVVQEFSNNQYDHKQNECADQKRSPGLSKKCKHENPPFRNGNNEMRF